MKKMDEFDEEMMNDEDFDCEVIAEKKEDGFIKKFFKKHREGIIRVLCVATGAVAGIAGAAILGGSNEAEEGLDGDILDGEFEEIEA